MIRGYYTVLLYLQVILAHRGEILPEDKQAAWAYEVT